MKKNARHLRVVSYNIHKGFSIANRRFVLSPIREAIRSLLPDIVFLQEILGHHKKHHPEGFFSQVEYLSDGIWTHQAYGKNAIYEDGHHGNAILSRFPFRTVENVDISVQRLARRGLLHSVLEISEKKHIHAMCLHLDLFKASRRDQLKLLVERIDDHVDKTHPLIVAGDFNDWREDVSDKLKEHLEMTEVFLESKGKHARTFPSRLPALKLDRIYYRGLKVIHAETLSKAPWNKLSDHLALLADFALGLVLALICNKTLGMH